MSAGIGCALYWVQTSPTVTGRMTLGDAQTSVAVFACTKRTLQQHGNSSSNYPDVHPSRRRVYCTWSRPHWYHICIGVISMCAFRDWLTHIAEIASACTLSLPVQCAYTVMRCLQLRLDCNSSTHAILRRPTLRCQACMRAAALWPN